MRQSFAIGAGLVTWNLSRVTLAHQSKPTKGADQRIECKGFKIKKAKGSGELAVASSVMEINQSILVIRTMGRQDQ